MAPLLHARALQLGGAASIVFFSLPVQVEHTIDMGRADIHAKDRGKSGNCFRADCSKRPFEFLFMTSKSARALHRRASKVATINFY
jgi:hypothetical protein